MGNKFDDMELPQEILDELEADAAAAEEAEVQEDDGMQTEDIYRVYMEELAAIPPCTAAENEELLGKVKAGVAGARERLIEGNLRNALMHVQNYINRGVPMADLIQEASMELMMLVDDAFEGSFEKLLESRIRVRMEEVISEQTSASNIEEVSKELAERFGREPKLEELAEYMKMTEDEVREIMKVTMDALSLSEANRALQS